MGSLVGLGWDGTVRVVAITLAAVSSFLVASCSCTAAVRSFFNWSLPDVTSTMSEAGAGAGAGAGADIGSVLFPWLVELCITRVALHPTSADWSLI